MRSRIPRVLPWLVIALIALIVVGFVRAQRGLVPPSGANAINEFAESMPPPQKLAVVSIGGRECFVWIGPIPRVWGTVDPISSGPPAYVFDDTGQLIDWSRDVGDDHHLDEYVEAARRASPITVGQAIDRSVKRVDK